MLPLTACKLTDLKHIISKNQNRKAYFINLSKTWRSSEGGEADMYDMSWYYALLFSWSSLSSNFLYAKCLNILHCFLEQLKDGEFSSGKYSAV